MAHAKTYRPERGKIVVVSSIPDCNFCSDGTPGPYDFATIDGPWANGCERHWKQYRVGPLGTGSGQLWITKEQVTPPESVVAPSSDQLYRRWMKRVDAILVGHIGVSSSDLPDFPSRDLFEQGESPIEGAIAAIEESDLLDVTDDLIEQIRSADA